MPLDNLRNRLNSLRNLAAGQGAKEFFPNGELKKMLTTDEVLGSLQDSGFQIPWHKRENIAVIVSSMAPTIFAILVRLGLEAKLETFIERGFFDGRLPLNEDQLEPIIPGFVLLFAQVQWEYIAHYFHKEQFNQLIESQRILPYMSHERVGGGAFDGV